jgi:cysteine synthase A
VGGSTGTNLIAVMRLAEEMAEAQQSGAIVTILCDGGERYGCTYYNDDWLSARDVAWQEHAQKVQAFLM